MLLLSLFDSFARMKGLPVSSLASRAFGKGRKIESCFSSGLFEESTEMSWPRVFWISEIMLRRVVDFDVS